MAKVAHKPNQSTPRVHWTLYADRSADAILTIKQLTSVASLEAKGDAMEAITSYRPQRLCTN